MWLVCPIAGVGKRLQPFTYSKPKAFLKIARKRLIDHILLKLKNSFAKQKTICGCKLVFFRGFCKKAHLLFLKLARRLGLNFSAPLPFLVKPRLFLPAEVNPLFARPLWVCTQ